MGRGRRVVLATLVASLAWLGTVAAASAAPAPIEGDWSYAGGVITVGPAAGGGLRGHRVADRLAAVRGFAWRGGLAVDRGARPIRSGSPDEHSWVQASTCALTGYFPATFAIAADGRSMEVCTTNPSAGQVCRTYARSGAAPSQPAVTCGSRGPVYGEQRVGDAVAAGCWADVSPGVYSTTQAARIGGFTVSPTLAGGELVINTNTKTVRATGGMHASLDGSGGGLPDFDPADLPVGRREAALPRAALPVARRCPARRRQPCGVDRGRPRRDPHGRRRVGEPACARCATRSRRGSGSGSCPRARARSRSSSTTSRGFSVGGVEAKLSDLAFPTPFVPLVLKSVSAKLEQPDPAKPDLRWRFEGQLETPVGCARRPGEDVSCLEVRAIVYLTGDGPVGGGVGVDNLDIPIGGTPLKLQGLAGEIVFKPSPGVALSGNGTLGGRIRGDDRGELFNLSATLALLSLATQGSDPCATPVKLSGSATLPVLEAAGGRAELGLKLCFSALTQRTALTELGATVDIGLPFDLASFRGTADGWYSPHAFSITGTSGVKIRSYPVAGGSYVISNVAAAACAKVGWIEVGAVWRWSGRGQSWNSCDLTAFTPQRPKAAQTAPTSVRIPAGQRAFAIRVRGNGAAPVIRLTGPGGAVVDTAGPVPLVTDRMIVDRDDARAVTTVILRRPRAGAWQIASAQPVAGVATARAKSRLRLRASVRGAGAQRRLAWRLTPRAGERVRFVDRTDGVARTIVSTRAARRAGALPAHAGPGARAPDRRRGRRRRRSDQAAAARPLPRPAARAARAAARRARAPRRRRRADRLAADTVDHARDHAPRAARRDHRRRGRPPPDHAPRDPQGRGRPGHAPRGHRRRAPQPRGDAPVALARRARAPRPRRLGHVPESSDAAAPAISSS